MDVQMHKAGIGGHGRPQRFVERRWCGCRAWLSTANRGASPAMLVFPRRCMASGPLRRRAAVMARSQGRLPMPPTFDRGWAKRGYPWADGYDERVLGTRNATRTQRRSRAGPADYMVAKTWAQMAIMPRNRAMDVSAAASSTT